jgi:elongator complex protein 3
VHIYGPAVRIGDASDGEAQHTGLGGKLIDEAKRIAWDQGYLGIAVISAIGTQEYYTRHGFTLDRYYMKAPL